VTVESASIGMERAQRRLGAPGLLGYLLIAVLVAIALGIYFAEAENLTKRGTWFVIGEASGITAAVLLPIAVIMTARLSILEWLFGDLTRVYVGHAIIGMTMFAVVSIHPLLYVTGTLKAGTRDAAHVIVPFHLVVLDWISYLAIAAALILTLYVRLRFAVWRLTHLLLGIAMILTGYSILISSETFDTFKIPGLRIFLFVLYGLGTAAFIWAALVSRFLEPKREYEITDAIHHEAADAVELRARPVGKPINFTAGQFVAVDLLDDRLQVKRAFEGHPFSIITAPGEEEIGLVVQARGKHTRRIQDLAREDEARALIHSPHGRFAILRPQQAKQLWVAGGVGVTPFLSMAAELAAHPERYSDREVTLVLVVDRLEQAYAVDRLRRYEERFPGLKVHVWEAGTRGRPTGEALLELMDGAPRDFAVMLCGPEGMVDTLEHQLHAAGVPHAQIRWQRAIGPPERWRTAAPTMRRLRLLTTASFVLFGVLVVVSTVGRAFF
jgi:predicted ferric reductase